MRKENMLVVEDEDIMREALVDYFSDGGHTVDTANDGEKALEKYNLEDYNVMIIDLRLPGRDGLSVLEEVRQKNPKAKVIIITAYPSAETEEEASLMPDWLSEIESEEDLPKAESPLDEEESILRTNPVIEHLVKRSLDLYRDMIDEEGADEGSNEDLESPSSGIITP